MLRAVLEQGQLVQPADVQERGLVCRVQHLVAVVGERPQEPVQVALRLRAQEQLGLFDEHDEALFAGLAQRLQRTDQGGRRRGRGRVAGSGEVGLGDAGRGHPEYRLRHEPIGSKRCRQEEHGHRASAPGGGGRRVDVEDDPVAIRQRRSEVDALGVACAHVSGRRRGPALLEHRPDRREHVGLANAGAADQRRHLVRCEPHGSGRSKPLDPNVPDTERGGAIAAP